MRRLTLAATLAAALAGPATAHAAFFPAEVIDGPSGDVVSVGDVDLSRDGNGAAVYVKRVDGVEHVFASRFVDGAFAPGERVDSGIASPSSQPVVAASDGGRLAIAYVSGGSLWTIVKPRDAAAFAAPTLVAEGGVSNPSIDMSINGATYVSYTQSGDVKVARANRDTPQFTVLPASVDVEPGRPAGDGTRRSRVMTSADGTALVVWGEQGGDGRSHVYARRLFELRLSTAPQDLTLPEVEGAAGTDADLPELDMEDDSSFAQVVFRQQTTGGPRLVMRRLVGSQFEAPIVFGQTANPGRVDLTGRGEGLFAFGASGNEVFGGTLFNNKTALALRLDAGNRIAPQAVPAVGENEDGAIAWLHGSSPGDATVRARYIDTVDTRPNLEGESILSVPDFGAVDTGAGFDAASSRAGDVTVVFVQGTEGNRRLVGATYDKPPARVNLFTTQKARRLAKLRWSAATNLFGGVTYRVVLNGTVIGESRTTEYIPPPGQIPDGQHRWQVQSVDRRGQVVVSRSRLLRVDNTPPSLRIGVTRKKRVITVTARGGDPDGALPTGLARVLVDFGDGRLIPMGRKASRRVSRTGSFAVRVKAVDKAGNETVQSRTVRIGR
jgi:hypothetical protein